tara:strand:+ start:1478 stop:1801 length:324 start_codon:yes stop_codon:yes gene_type:complete
MFEKITDFYSQELRIDLAPAGMLADLSPQNEAYGSAAARGGFIVSVAQGDVHESVYVSLVEQVFNDLFEARELFENLRSEHPTATCLDFVTYTVVDIPPSSEQKSSL